ncbi:hypothetical protein CDAR_185141 [Caerostris darwini]|uniref:Uncharacterized protein n=1 Tax=Caerostris darwini TaxID=1538125 RepID=A0AAV4SRQ3_9ARAC|nr:hypothetical protein CDAR_185141 [Caerostris darwini]
MPAFYIPNGWSFPIQSNLHSLWLASGMRRAASAIGGGGMSCSGAKVLMVNSKALGRSRFRRGSLSICGGGTGGGGEHRPSSALSPPLP